MMIIAKIDAQLQGLKRYFTGIPCQNGHKAERYTASGICIDCAKASRARQNPPTGFARGRPRAGEVRPISPNAVKTDVYRKKRLATDPKFRETLNAYGSKWRENNHERSNEIAREAKRRKKEREEHGNE